MEIQISNILASNPNEQLWDSEELAFSDNTQTVKISTPPVLSVTSFTSSSTDIKEGQAVTFTISVSNDGEATASGTLLLMQSGSQGPQRILLLMDLEQVKSQWIFQYQKIMMVI